MEYLVWLFLMLYKMSFLPVRYFLIFKLCLSLILIRTLWCSIIYLNKVAIFRIRDHPHRHLGIDPCRLHVHLIAVASANKSFYAQWMTGTRCLSLVFVTNTP
jgi:hypothetical protein